MVTFKVFLLLVSILALLESQVLIPVGCLLSLSFSLLNFYPFRCLSFSIPFLSNIDSLLLLSLLFQNSFYIFPLSVFLTNISSFSLSFFLSLYYKFFHPFHCLSFSLPLISSLFPFAISIILLYLKLQLFIYFKYQHEANISEVEVPQTINQQGLPRYNGLNSYHHRK